MKYLPLGLPLIRISPVIRPTFLRAARTSKRVLLPAPDGPMSAVRHPDFTYLTDQFKFSYNF